MSTTVKLGGLVAIVTHRTHHTDKRKKPQIVGSNVYIAIEGEKNNIGVASAILGGKYDSTQALVEFKKNPGRFTFIETGKNMASAMGLL